MAKIYISGGAIILEDVSGYNDKLSINPGHFDWQVNSGIYSCRDKLENQSYELGAYTDIEDKLGSTFTSEALLESFLNSAINRTDVFIQDQTTSPIELFLHNDDSVVTITSDLSAGDQTINLVSGHGFVAGEFIYIVWYSNILQRNRFYQGEVITSAATSITVGKPFYENVLTTEISQSTRNNVNMAVDGSVTPQEFHIKPPSGVKWDLTRLMLIMTLTSQPDDGLFGNISRLTNGVYFGIEQPGFVGGYLGGFHDNSDFRRTAFDVGYHARSGGGGTWGLSMRKTFGGQDKYGVVIRLDGDKDQEFVGVVQDDLTVGSDVISMKVVLMGHYVDE